MTDLIRKGCKRAGINSDAAIARRIGMPYQTLIRRRMPERMSDQWRLCEIRAILQIGIFSEEEELILLKGVE